MIRGADVLVRTLAAAGVRQVFSLSGNHVMPVFDAALDAKLPILHVRHEAAAVHMADAWARLTGEVGVALVTGGPGHANAVAALYTALGAESPVLLISGHAPLEEMGKGAFQEMRQAALAAPVTKAAWTARSAERLGKDLARALRKARSGRPGPVHLSVPTDLLEATVEAKIPGDFSIVQRPREPFPAELLAAARPLVIAGPSMMREPEVKRLEEASGVPVIGMESPRGVNDPALGRLAEVLSRADAVLLLGKRPDYTLKFGRVFAEGCRVLRVGAVPQLPSQPHAGSWRDEVRAALAYRPPEWKTAASAPGGAVHPVALCRAVQSLLEAPDAVLVSDGGEFGQWAQACLSAPHRVINGVAGAIGAALPFAAAAKLAYPQAPVVAMLGDGTFGFHMSEIDTAVRYGLSYVAVVGNDACWNAEYQIQVRSYGQDRARGLELLPSRYGAASAALGAFGEEVHQEKHLADALARASTAGRPAVVNVTIERLPAPKY